MDQLSPYDVGRIARFAEEAGVKITPACLGNLGRYTSQLEAVLAYCWNRVRLIPEVALILDGSDRSDSRTSRDPEAEFWFGHSLAMTSRLPFEPTCFAELRALISRDRRTLETIAAASGGLITAAQLSHLKGGKKVLNPTISVVERAAAAMGYRIVFEPVATTNHVR